MTIDFGPLGTLKSSAQITTRYHSEELIGRQVIAVVNFPVKRIANFNSQCLVLGATQGNDVFLLPLIPLLKTVSWCVNYIKSA